MLEVNNVMYDLSFNSTSDPALSDATLRGLKSSGKREIQKTNHTSTSRHDEMGNREIPDRLSHH